MATHLSAEDCKRLKDAGFPQDGSIALYYDRNGVQYRGYESDWRYPSAWCPNSDELIAAIQERWGIRDIAPGMNEHGQWDIEINTVSHRSGYGTDKYDTLVAALAELYIALSGGDDIEGDTNTRSEHD